MIGEQQQTRRRKPTVKLSLETVEERIVPSASDMSQQMAPIIAAVQQEVSNAIQIIEQDIAQVEAMIVQEVDHLLGIPTTPNPASGSGAGSGSGSGSGATATHNAPSQQLSSATQQSGNGSGGGATGTAKDNNPSTGVSKMQPMTGSGSFGSIVTYTWDPEALGAGTGHGSGSINYLASDFHNWLKDGQVQRYDGTIPGTKSTDKVLFDGSISNDQIEWNTSFTFSTMTIGGTGAYTGQQTLVAGVNIDLTGVDSISAWETADSKFNLEFQDHNQILKIDNGATFGNFDISGYNDDSVILAGGATTIAGNPGSGKPAYTEELGVNLYIYGGAQLNDNCYNTLVLTNDNLQIVDQGMMIASNGTGVGKKLIDNGGKSGSYINVDGGSLLYGGSNGASDTFTVPIYIQNGGLLSVSKTLQTGGTLIVQDGSNYIFPNGKKESVYMTGSGSQVLLFYASTLEADDDYYQADGALLTDSTNCIIKDGAQSNGTATIAGGVVTISENNLAYNQLIVNCSTLNFNGQLQVSISGKNPPQCDSLWVSGTTKIQGNSSLKLFVDNGPPPANKQWAVIIDSTGDIQLPMNFQMPITTDPNTPGLSDKVDPANAKQYIVTS